MVDFLQPTQDAVFALLSAAITADGTLVRQHVPRDYKGDYVKTGEIVFENQGSKDAPHGLIAFEVIVVTRGEENAPAIALVGTVMGALEGVVPESTSLTFSRGKCLNASVSGASPIDGLTYVGLLQFEIYAQPAD